jgi:hypothetical protein
MRDKPTYKTEHVRHDQVVCLAPELFWSVPKGKRKAMFLDVRYETSEAVYHFQGRNVLGATDLRVLQGLIALAPVCSGDGNRLVVGPDSSSPAGLEFRRTLDLSGHGVEMEAMVVETTCYELAREIGYTSASVRSGHLVDVIRAALERLWTVSVLVDYKNEDRREGYHLISKYQSTAGGKFAVAINPRMAQCVMGVKGYTRIEMAEIRALKTDPARFIHQRLCGFLNPGQERRLVLDTLCGYVWPGQALNINTIKYRKRCVKAALMELEGLGWMVDEYAPEKYKIVRRGLAN